MEGVVVLCHWTSSNLPANSTHVSFPLKLNSTSLIHSILTYNELDHSLPACLPVSINFKYYYHCGVGKKIGLVIWKDFLSAAKVCNNKSLSVVGCWLSSQFQLIQIDERPMLCVRTYVLPQQHLRQGVANQSRA
jgi:hypothetical protein